MIKVEASGAPSEITADRVARSIANSPLVKTDLAGGDPNWGRVVSAAGAPGIGFSLDRVTLTMGAVPPCLLVPAPQPHPRGSATSLR